MTRRRTYKRLQVRLGQVVGELFQDKTGCIHFVPDKAWIARDQRPRLGLRFLENPNQSGRGHLPHWFENLLPERGSFNRQWLCRRLGIDAKDSMALLCELGLDLPGAVEVVALESDAASPRQEARPSAAEPAPRFSLAGMQLKFSMLRRGERFVWPIQGESGGWILKLPGQEYPELVDVELATMRWAKACGLQIPQVHKIPVDLIAEDNEELLNRAEHAFAIKRFDRDGARKIHQEDFAQVFGLPPEDKYGTQPSPKQRAGTYNYGVMGRVIADISEKAELHRFARRLAFVIASGNDDAHLKNWSLQWGHQHRPRLSPCYDQVCTISWPELDQGWQRSRVPTLALPLGDVLRFDELDLGALDRFAVELTQTQLVSVMLDMLRRARSSWKKLRQDAPERMVLAVDEHWNRVPLLRELS